MKKVVEVFRILLVSLEALWLLLVAGLFVWQDLTLVFFGRILLEHNDVTTWMPALPITLCGTACFLAFKLTEPKDGSNKALYDWPDYWRLAYRRNIGIIWCGIAVFFAVVPWMFRDELSLEWVGGLFLIAIGLAAISSASLLFASFVLKRMMAK